MMRNALTRLNLLIRSSRIVRRVHTCTAASMSACDHMQVNVSNHCMHIQFNNVVKRNSMHFAMYTAFSNALQQAQSSKHIKSVVVSGSPGIYCSGNDLSALQTQPFDLWPDIGIQTIEHMDAFIDSLIDLQKPIIALVDGPAVGIGCSTLGLFDVIIASDRAFFWTPFSRIALVPEGCSTYTFPHLLGLHRSAQMTLFNHRLDVWQALQWTFIHCVHPCRPIDGDNRSSFDQQTSILMDRLSQGNLIDLGWFAKVKRIPRDPETRRHLHQINRQEGTMLRQAWLTDQYRQYLKSFFDKNHSQNQ